MKIKLFLKKHKVIIFILIASVIFVIGRKAQMKIESERSQKRISEAILGVTDEDVEKAKLEMYLLTEYLKTLE